jgi:hypothetical protein
VTELDCPVLDQNFLFVVEIPEGGTHSHFFTNLWAKNGDKLVKKWEWVPLSRISTTNKLAVTERDRA